MRRFFIPTEDEWYKAAYQKNDGATGNYWNFPTSSNTRPINTLPDPGNHANIYDLFGTGNRSYSIGSPYYRTEVGAFENSASPYGTFDQGGNVQEWNETDYSSSLRVVRGGSFAPYAEAGDLVAGFRAGSAPTLEWPFLGFRVATVPEPASISLCLAGVALLGLRRSGKWRTVPA